MVDKTSLAFILTPSTPTSHRHSVCDMRAGFMLTDMHRHSLVRPLTSYLKHSTEAPRVDRVRVRPLSTEYQLSAQSLGKPVKKDDLTRKSSKFCIVEGCTSRAKHARRCWKHGTLTIFLNSLSVTNARSPGGSVKCKIPECANRAKSKGVCWSHGGGSPCSVDDCDTIAVSNGFCWAHGGGKRCQERGCSRPAYERTRNYCVQHYDDLHQAAEKLL